MLVADQEHNALHDCQFLDIVRYLRAGDRLVINNTKVIPARLDGYRLRQSDMGVTRAKLQVNLISPLDGQSWQVLIKPAKRIAVGERVEFSPQLWADLTHKDDQGATLRFNLWGAEFDAALGQIGQMPLPPYIAAKRQVDARDSVDYQTIFARHSGAVAAPTASLHFDDALLTRLHDMGVDFSEITLHVGAGTFLPVKSDTIAGHKMHAEWGEISAQSAGQINQTRAAGGRVIAIGNNRPAPVGSRRTRSPMSCLAR